MAAQPQSKPEMKSVKRSSTDLELFSTEAEALAAVKDRVKGHRRVFIVTSHGRTTYVVASHPAFVGQKYFQDGGGTIVEAGKAPRAPRSMNPEGFLAALNAMPEVERKLILEQIAEMNRKSAKK